MSGILGKTKNSSSRKSIVLIQIGTKSPKLFSYSDRNNRNKFSYEKRFFSYNVVPILSYKFAAEGFYLHPSLLRRQPIPDTISDRWNSPIIPASEHAAKAIPDTTIGTTFSAETFMGLRATAIPATAISHMGLPGPTRVGTRNQSCFRYDDRNKFTDRDTDQAQPQALSSYDSRPRGTPLHTPIGTRRKAAPDTNIGTMRGGHPFSPKEEVSMVANRASPDPSPSAR